MSDKFTPGPWEWVSGDRDEIWESGFLHSASLRTVEHFGTSETKVIDGKSYTSFSLPKFILDCDAIGGDEESEANARLISAAPDLLAALRDCLAFIERDMPTIASSGPERLAALEAIQKATGVQP